MGLSDISGVFSRYFVVGHFLPAFFVLAGLKLSLSKAMLPAAIQPATTSSFLVIGGLSVLIGMVLTGLNIPITRLFEGYPLMEPAPATPPTSRVRRRLIRARFWLMSTMVSRQQAVFDRLVEMKSHEGLPRRIATWRLDIWFPPSRDEVLPTRLGNRIRAFETYGRGRWGLSTVVAWPRIEMLLGDQEEMLYRDAQAEFLFFLNGSIGAFLAALILGADGAANHPHPLWLVWIYPLPLILSYLLYVGSLPAAEQWGDAVRSGVDLHRLDLYSKLGLSVPNTFAEERELGAAVSNALQWGTPIPDRFKAPAPK